MILTYDTYIEKLTMNEIQDNVISTLSDKLNKVMADIEILKSSKKSKIIFFTIILRPSRLLAFQILILYCIFHNKVLIQLASEI